MECPRCGLFNPPEAIRCDCGYNFQTREMGTPVPQHLASSPGLGTPAGGYFSFRTMISPTLIKIEYILGMIAITVTSIVLLFQSLTSSKRQTEQLLLEVALEAGLLVVGNIVWRSLCEGSILAFSIHDILGSIEKELKRRSQ